MIDLLIFLLVFVVIVAIAIWIVRETVPAPFQRIALAIIGLIAIVVLLEHFAPVLGGGRFTHL